MKEYVSYIVFEGEMTRMERIVKRLWILCIILFVALLTTNYMWLSHNQYSGINCVEAKELP